MKKIIAVLTCLVLVVALMTGCSEKSEIKSLISDFQGACNELDLNEMLECIDPAISVPIKTAAGLIGMFSDTSTDDMLEQLSNVLISGTPQGGKEFFSSIKISVDEVSISGDKADVSAGLKYSISGEGHETETVFKCVKSEDKWYISSFSLKK